MQDGPKEAYPGASLLIGLVPVPVPSSYRFPTVAELVQELTVDSYHRENGLFSALLGDPHVLWTDLIENPDKYDPEASRLIQEVVSGRKKLNELTNQEMQVLDLATLDYNQVSRKKTEEPPKPPPVSVKEVEDEDEKDIEYHEPTEAPISVDGMKPYWWVK